MAKENPKKSSSGLARAVETVEDSIAHAVESVGKEASKLTDPIFHREVSVRARLAHTVGPVLVRPIVSSFPLVRPTFTLLKLMDHMAGLAPGSRNVARTTVSTDTWSAHRYEPLATTCNKTLIYFHGGAFLSCGLGTHRSIVEALAIENGCSIVSVGYRQYPEVLFDETVEDCVEAVEWAVRSGARYEDVVLVGDSAGGGLAMRVAGDLLARGKRVAGVVGLSAWLDFDAEAKQSHKLSKRDAYIPARRLESVARLILGRRPNLEDSPISSLVPNFPPILLICGANEVLRVDTEAAHEKAKSLGIQCETHYFRGGVHAFPVATRLFPEGPRARELMRSFIQSLGTADESEAA